MKKKINKSLYEDNHQKTSTKGTGFKDKQKAIDTINIIKDKNITYQKQVINTMYNRAKYHPYQTEDMRDAMKIYEKWLKNNKKSSKKLSKKKLSKKLSKKKLSKKLSK